MDSRPQWLLGKINKNKYTPRYIIVKLHKTKDREKILNVARGEGGNSSLLRRNRPTADFSTAIVEDRRRSGGISNGLKENNCQSRILYPVKILSKNNLKERRF